MLWASNEFNAALQSGTTHLAYGLRATLQNGSVFAWTNLRRPATLAPLYIPIRPGKVVSVPGAVYDHRAALRVTNAQFSDDAGQTDNMEATLCFGDALSESQVRFGLFENAAFSLLLFDWHTPLGSDGVPRAMLRMRGDFGARTIRGGEVTWKLRSLSNRLRGEILECTSRDSLARWGDPELLAAGLSEGGQTHDGFATVQVAQIVEVDGAFPRRRFRLGIPTYPDDRFCDGMSWFQGGQNAGFKCGTLIHEPGTNWFTTSRLTPKPFSVGDQVKVRVRAPRTFEEWLTYFGNGKYAPCQPGIPTVESANRVLNS